MLDNSMSKNTNIDTSAIVAVILLSAIFSFFLYRGVWFGGMQQKTHEYITEITYQTGTSDTLVLRGKEYPRLYDTGCIFDKQFNTYICGVRKIKVLVANEAH